MNIRKWFARTQYSMERFAELLGEREASNRLLLHYLSDLARIDPHKDWWRFAELKQITTDIRANLAALDEAIATLKPKGWNG